MGTNALKAKALLWARLDPYRTGLSAPVADTHYHHHNHDQQQNHNYGTFARTHTKEHGLAHPPVAHLFLSSHAGTSSSTLQRNVNTLVGPRFLKRLPSSFRSPA